MTMDELCRIRKQLGFTQATLSDKIGIPKRTIEEWEAGRRNPPEYIPGLIAWALTTGYSKDAPAVKSE